MLCGYGRVGGGRGRVGKGWYLLLYIVVGVVPLYLRGVAAWVALSCMTEPLHICPRSGVAAWANRGTVVSCIPFIQVG